jgi:transposase
MDTEQFRQDVAEGTVEVDRLVDLVVSQQKLIVQQQAELEALKKQLEELKHQLEKNPTQRLDEAYSEKAENERQAKAQGKPKRRKKPNRQGRITTAEKIARAARTETVYPEDCDPDDCRPSHTRVAWRLEDGRARASAHLSVDTP